MFLAGSLKIVMEKKEKIVLLQKKWKKGVGSSLKNLVKTLAKVVTLIAVIRKIINK